MPDSAPRTRLIAYAYELRQSDLLVEEGRDVPIPKNGIKISDDGVIISLSNGNTREYGRNDILDIKRVFDQPNLEVTEPVDLIAYGFETQVGDLLVTNRAVPVSVTANNPAEDGKGGTLTLADGSTLSYGLIDVLEIQRDASRVSGGAESVTNV